MVECTVFLNQYKVALSGYALRDFINLVVMYWMDACEKLEQMLWCIAWMHRDSVCVIMTNQWLKWWIDDNSRILSRAVMNAE